MLGDYSICTRNGISLDAIVVATNYDRLSSGINTMRERKGGKVGIVLIKLKTLYEQAVRTVPYSAAVSFTSRNDTGSCLN